MPWALSELCWGCACAQHRVVAPRFAELRSRATSDLPVTTGWSAHPLAAADAGHCPCPRSALLAGRCGTPRTITLSSALTCPHPAAAPAAA